MKIIINESQLRLIVENEKKEKLFPILGSMINSEDDIDSFMKTYNEYKDVKGYDGIKYIGELGIYNNKLFYFCRQLVEVVGKLIVTNNYIVDFPKLKRVGGDLTLSMTSVHELPNLEYVGGDLIIKATPMVNKTTEEELREKINVEGDIILK